MVETLLEDVRDHIAESSKHIDHAKGVLTEACEDLLHKSQRAAKAGRNATEDFVDHTERRVRKYPKSSVASAIVVGIALGFVAGWLLASRDWVTSVARTDKYATGRRRGGRASPPRNDLTHTYRDNSGPWARKIVDRR